MANEKVELDLILKRLADLEKVPKMLDTSTKAAAALQKQFESINTQIVELAAQTNGYMKKFESLVKGANNLNVARLARERQDKVTDNKADLEKQIAAQRIRYSQALLDNERLYGAAKTSHLATTQKELSALNNLLAQKKAVNEQERESASLNQRVLTIQDRINQSVSKYRVARQLGTSGTVASRDDALTRAGLLIDRQRLVVEQARVVANGQYTAELARQENRLTRLMNIQNQIKASPVERQPRVIQPIDPASLFKVQAELVINYTLMNQLFNLFNFGTKYVLEFDKALKDLQAVTVTTNTDMASLAETFVDVSKATKFSAVEIAQASIVMGQAGFSAQQINKSIESIAMLATATGSDLTQAVDVATSAITIFNLTADDTAHVANVMTGALNLSKLTMDKLQYGLQYAGNTAATMGITLEELTAALGAMSNAGIKSGSTLGTGLNQLLVELQSPTKKMIEQLHKVGLTMQDVNVQARGLTNVIDTLNTAGFSSANAFKAFELRAARAYLALANNVDSAKEYEASLLLTNAATEANRVQMESLSNSLKKLSNNFGAVILQIAEPLKDALVVVANILSKVLGVLSEFPRVTAIAGTALLSLGGAAVLIRLSTLISGILGLSGAISAVGRAAVSAIPAVTLFGRTIALTPIGAFATILAVTIGLFASLGSTVDDATKEMDKLQASIDKSTGSLSETKDRIGSVDSEIARLINRYGELSTNNDALGREVISVKAKFGEFSSELATTSITTIDQLIEALRTLRGELGQFQLGEANAALAESSEKIRLSVQKTIKDSALYARKTGNFRTPKELAEGPVGQALAPFKEFDFDSSSPDERDKLKNVLLNEINQANANIAKLTKYKHQLELDAKNNNKDTKNYIETAEKQRDAAKDYRESLQGAYTQLAQASKLKDVQAEAVVNSSKVAMGEYEKITNLEIDISKKETELGKAKTLAKKKQLRQQLDDMKKDAEAQRKALTAPDSDVIGGISKETGLNPREAAAASAKILNDRLAAAASKAGAVMDKATDELGSSTQEFYDKFTELTKLKIIELERSLKHTTDDLNAQIANVDATISEVNDKTRGGLRGVYSDAEVSMMEDKKKALQTQALSDQVAKYQELNPLVDELVKHQQELYLASVAQYDAAKGGKGEGRALKTMVEANRDYNDALEKQAELRNKSTEASIKLAAATGQETEAHKSLGEQIVYSISTYYDQMEIQNSLRLNIQKNVIQIMDTASSSFSTFVQNVATGTKSVSASFREMATSIIKAMLDIAARSVATQAMGGLGSILGSIFPSLTSLVGGATQVYSSPIGPTQSVNLATGFNGMMVGGAVRRYAPGGAVGTRDSVMAMLRPGEYVLRESAVQMIGQKNLDQINTMGNRRVSDSSSSVAQAAAANPAVQLGTPVNVYVVAPEQKPVLTNKDVLAIISDDIYRSGQTAKLIKTVIGGRT